MNLKIIIVIIIIIIILILLLLLIIIINILISFFRGAVLMGLIFILHHDIL